LFATLCVQPAVIRAGRDQDAFCAEHGPAAID
jgi:hypothetical protein